MDKELPPTNHVAIGKVGKNPQLQHLYEFWVLLKRKFILGEIPTNVADNHEDKIRDL